MMMKNRKNYQPERNLLQKQKIFNKMKELRRE